MSFADANSDFGLPDALTALFDKPVDLVAISAVKNPFFCAASNLRAPYCMRLECKKTLFDIEQAGALIAELTRRTAEA